MNTWTHDFQKRLRIAFALIVGLLALVGALALLGGWSGGVLPPARAATATDVSGSITGVVTWTVENSPYIVTDVGPDPSDGVTVEDGATLIIEPGVEVQFDSDKILDVLGELRAVGTMTSPITFTSSSGSPTAGDWAGITFDQDASGQLAWCEMAYAGSRGITQDDAGLIIHAPNVTISRCHIHDNLVGGVAGWDQSALNISHTTIEDNGGHGVIIDGGVNNPTLEHVTIKNNGGIAIWQHADVMVPTYRSITATGNLTDALVIHDGNLARGAYWDFGDAGLPVHIYNGIMLGSDDLTVQPGTTLNFADGGVAVWGTGSLWALGRPDAPITFTALSSASGGWEGVATQGGRIDMSYCEVSYGGANGEPMLDLEAGDSILNSWVHHSAAAGIEASGQPSVTHNQIYSNTDYGLYTSNTSEDVDARYNWWGHTSGPYHDSKNPDGKGDPVSNHVLFTPWLTDTEGGGAGPEPEPYVTVRLGGPNAIHSGEVTDFAASYSNRTTRTFTSPMALELPIYASYVDSTGDGTYWPQRHEVFWDQDLAPGESMVESVRVRFLWGLEDGSEHFAKTYPANILPEILEEHEDYSPIETTSEPTLTQAEFEAQCAAEPELQQLYDQFIDEGRVFASASRRTFDSGDVITQAMFLAHDGNAVTFLQFDGEHVSSTQMDATKIKVQDVNGGSIYDPELMEWINFGEWANPAAQSESYSILPQSVGSVEGYAICWVNCATDKVVGLGASLAKLKAVQAVLDSVNCYGCVTSGDRDDCIGCATAVTNLPVVGEVVDVAGLLWCSEECKEPEGCQEDEIDCRDRQAVYWECNEETGQLEFGRIEECVKDWSNIHQYTCLPNHGCIDLEEEIPDWEDSLASRLRVQYVNMGSGLGHDPNAKLGEQGDLLPGQRVSYTVQYENVGTDAAQGVYIVDELSEHFDPTTLRFSDGGRYVSATRSVIWEVGTVPPSGEVGSSGEVTFSVALKPGLPGGTVISNQAVVHFPSVPEETPTNSVVNVIQPVRARPQTVRTGVMQPVSITLQGHEAGGTLLTAWYTVTAEPRYGELTGDPPELTYRPMGNFSGLDHFSFRVSNGVTTSRPAEVTIIVEPGDSDTIAPEVRWTDPLSGAMDVWASVVPVYSAHEGEPVYTPIVNVGFSEAMSETTVTSRTVQLLDGEGNPIPATVTYDEMGRHARLVPAESLPSSGVYSGRVLTGVRDASGNPLAEAYVWPFQVDLEMQRVYLPLVLRSAES